MATTLASKPANQRVLPKLTAENIRHYMRFVGITEPIVVHEQDADQFYQEQGIRELGRGGEGAVYFLRGHVVKVVERDYSPSVLREIAHMLHLNPGFDSRGAMGDRVRQDWPSLLWVYCLSNGSVAVGMKPFDLGDSRGSTFFERLHHGPNLDRDQTMRALRGICQSMVYAHKEGIIHHDLKPANIFVPADPSQSLCVFDLGQALWKNPAWGRDWRRHEHNFLYWYNGTYRYMHRQRRLAHLAAIAVGTGHKPETMQQESFKSFIPGFYDDVFSFARVVRDVLRSSRAELRAEDRNMLFHFYRDLMGLSDTASIKGSRESTVLRRLRSAFTTANPAPMWQDAQARWPSMPQVLFDFELRLAAVERI